MSTINEKALRRWLENEDEKLKNLYAKEPKRKPVNFASNDDALEALRKKYIKYSKKLLLVSGKKKLDLADAAKLIIENVAVVAVPVTQGFSLAIYDYDKKVYTFSTTTVLNDYIVLLLGASSQQIISSMTTTLIGLRRQAAIYNPLPKYKIAVGNGIYNCLTGKLEDFTPKYSVLTKIKTNYIANAKAPRYEDGFTLEKMITALSNGNLARKILLGQICKSIITGHSLKPGFFVVLGRGGDGKSTFFTMIANMIGQENVAYVNFSEIASPDKMLETMNKKMILGMDNDTKIYIKKTSLIKTMASHEMITLSRKYLSAISIPFTGTVVQLCNEFPRFSETGSSMKRRLVPFKAENSHYENHTENDNIDNVYVKDHKFLEYALWFFLNQNTNPYYSDFSDIDRSIALDALEVEDSVGQFVTELRLDGVLSSINKSIPSTHLYAAYQDWMKLSNPGNSVLSSRSFSMKITEPLFRAGYTAGDRKTVVRPSSLENTKQYSSSSWGIAKDYPNLAEIIQSNAASRVFIFDHAPATEIEIRRRGRPITALQYFKVDTLITHFINTLPANDKFYTMSAHNDDEKLINISKEIEETHEKVVALDKEISHDDFEPPCDVRVAMRQEDYEALSKYKEWIAEINKLSDDKEITMDKYLSLLDSSANMVQQAVYEGEKRSLISTINELRGKVSPKQVTDIINTILDKYLKDADEGGDK